MAFENKDEIAEKSYDDAREALSKNTLIRKPLPRLGKRVGSKRGSAKKFTPTRMRNAINRFFAQCEKRDDMPTIKGLMIYLGMDQSQFYQYLKYPEFTDMMEHTRLIISHWAEETVFKCEGRTEGKIAYMKNVHAWSDKIETKNENLQVTLTPEQAKARIEALAPRLLEVLKDQRTVNQIGVADREPEVIDVEVVEEPRRRV
jgi:hypothetical protein